MFVDKGDIFAPFFFSKVMQKHAKNGYKVQPWKKAKLVTDFAQNVFQVSRGRDRTYCLTSYR